MKFDVCHPEAKYLEQFITKDGSCIGKGRVPGKCWNCGELTTWIEMSFQAHLCSDECCIKKWKEYFLDC